MEAMIAGLAGFLTGWVLRAMQRPRGSYGRLSNGQPPERMTVDEWVRRRGSNPPPPGAKPAPSAWPPEKPRLPLGRVTDAHGRTIGYRPLSIQPGTPNPPPSEP